MLSGMSETEDSSSDSILSWARTVRSVLASTRAMAGSLAEQVQHTVDPGYFRSWRRSADLAPMFRDELLDFALVVLDSAAELVEGNIRWGNPSLIHGLEKSQSGTRPA